MIFKDKVAAQLPVWRERITKLIRENGRVKIDEVDISQVYGGMRDVKSMVTDISYLDPQRGIRLRGYSIPEILAELPKPKDMEIPPVGGLYYLLVVGELPTLEEAMSVEAEWKIRGQVPAYVFDMLKTMPSDTHPMTLFSQAILALQRESVFVRRYTEGMRKAEYWYPTLEDSLNLTAKLPAIAAYIYNLKIKSPEDIDKIDVSYNPDLDWSANFAHMIGNDNPEYTELCRLFFILHSDHEVGNASAHATHLVASTLSDIYYACSAGMNALAGPLHGLANRECRHGC